MSSAAFSHARTRLMRNLRPLVIRKDRCPNTNKNGLSRLASNPSDAFSLGPTLRHFSASQNLSDLLAKELAEEIETGNTEMPPDLDELKQSLAKDWKIVDDGSMTRLYRTVGSSKVVVSFHCQDTVEDPNAGYEEDEEDQDEEEFADPFRFMVTSSRAGKTLVMNCLSQDGTAQIEGVAMTTDDNETILANGGTINAQQYQGPDFHELDHGVQEGFHEYLQDEIGVDDDVAAFISMYADYKEEAEYVQFLKDTKNLLS